MAESLSPQSYEFDQSQNKLIEQLANRMNFVAFIGIISGAIAIIGGLFVAILSGASTEDETELGALLGDALGSVLQGGFLVVIGVLTQQAAAAFTKVVETQGSDIEYLMRALGKLKVIYTIQFWILVVAFVFIGLVLGVAIIGFFLGGGT
jgi:hypothetical protein